MNARLTLLEIRAIETLAPEKRALLDEGDGTREHEVPGHIRSRLRILKDRVAEIRQQELAVYSISEEIGRNRVEREVVAPSNSGVSVGEGVRLENPGVLFREFTGADGSVQTLELDIAEGIKPFDWGRYLRGEPPEDPQTSIC